jgi:hypothetical protein
LVILQFHSKMHGPYNIKFKFGSDNPCPQCSEGSYIPNLLLAFLGRCESSFVLQNTCRRE